MLSHDLANLPPVGKGRIDPLPTDVYRIHQNKTKECQNTFTAGSVYFRSTLIVGILGCLETEANRSDVITYL